MTVAQAIAKLRKKLKYTQAEFAKELRVKPVSISRYENGRHPRAEVIKRLSDLADKAGAPHLRDLFDATWKGNVVSKVENLPSAGAERRVPRYQLEIWKLHQREIYEALTGLMKKGHFLTSEQWLGVVKGTRDLAESTWNDLLPYTVVESEFDKLDPTGAEFDNWLTPIYGFSKDWLHCLYEVQQPAPRASGGGLLSGRRSLRPPPDEKKS